MTKLSKPANLNDIFSKSVNTKCFQELGIVGELKAKSDILLRLHGAFMIAAWIGAASLGMMVARYFKQTWTGAQCCKKGG